MKNTVKFGPTARLTSAFAHLDRSSAIAGEGDDVDLDLDSEDDSEDDDSEDDDSEDDDSEDDDSEDDEGDEEESDADDDEDTFEEDVTAEFGEDDDSEDDEGDDEGDDESDADEDEFEVESSDADEDEVDEAAVIAALESEGLCFVIASSDDSEILESDVAEAVASLEDDEFEEDVTDLFTAESSDEGDDEFEEDDSDEEEEEDDEDEDEEEDDEGEDEDEEEDEGDYEGDASEDDDVDSESDDEELLAPVATEEFLANASADDVEFHLTDDPSNPVLNVIVASIPAARITLASFGTHASEMGKIFRTPRYAAGLRTAMARQGVLNLLKNSRAEFYATAYRNTDLFEEACASADAVSNERVAVAMSGLREDFVDAIHLVSAGMDKNFFQIENPLKRALFIQLAHAGVQNPAEVIDTAFAEASAAHFEALVGKAVEIMDKSATAREELRDAIGESGIIDRSKSAHASAEHAIPVAQTAHAGVAVARELGAQTAVTASLTGTVAERKEVIRQSFGR